MSPGHGPRGSAARNRRERRGAISRKVLKQSYVRQIKKNEPPFCSGGKEFSPYDSEQNREVVLSPSGAPEHPKSKSVWVGVLL